MSPNRIVFVKLRFELRSCFEWVNKSREKQSNNMHKQNDMKEEIDVKRSCLSMVRPKHVADRRTIDGRHH